eukprot:UN33059
MDVAIINANENPELADEFYTMYPNKSNDNNKKTLHDLLLIFDPDGNIPLYFWGIIPQNDIKSLGEHCTDLLKSYEQKIDPFKYLMAIYSIEEGKEKIKEKSLFFLYSDGSIKEANMGFKITGFDELFFTVRDNVDWPSQIVKEVLDFHGRRIQKAKELLPGQFIKSFWKTDNGICFKLNNGDTFSFGQFVEKEFYSAKDNGIITFTDGTKTEEQTLISPMLKNGHYNVLRPFEWKHDNPLQAYANYYGYYNCTKKRDPDDFIASNEPELKCEQPYQKYLRFGSDDVL